MKVYHYMKAKYALESIRKRRLKIAQFNDLNDPFELIAVENSDKEQRKILLGWKKIFEKKWGVLCFSRTWNNPVLWSHYADRHKGMCLGFEITDDYLMPVRYTKNRLNIDLEHLYDRGVLNQKTMQRMLTTKFYDWRYEQESRVFSSLKQSDTVTNLYFSDFNENMRLTDIIAGPLCDITFEEIYSCRQEQDKDAEIIKSRLAFKEFKIVKNLQGFKK